MGSNRSGAALQPLILALRDDNADVRVVAAGALALIRDPRAVDPLIETWDIDLNSFAMEIVLNQRLAPGHSRRLEFVERELDERVDEEPGLKEFLRDRSLSGDLAEEEARFLGSLRFKGKRPTPLYYYRALQNLRDPLHFRDE